MEVKPLGAAFDGLGTTLSRGWNPGFSSGTFQDIIASVMGLTPGQPHHLRARLRYDPSQGIPAVASRWIYAPLSGDARGVHFRVFTCGNGVLEGNEACDDGNNAAGDCCSATCAFENAGTLCRAASGACDIAEMCTGSSAACPADAPAPDGTGCNDGDLCTQSDTCQAGGCTGSNPVVCTALDQCHDPGTCNPANGVCSNPNTADGFACNDADACTQSDTCQSGTCTGSNPVTCTALDQCHDIGTCDSMTGLCSDPVKADGSSCDDNNPCTQSDTCQSGICTGQNPIICSPKNECEEAGTCDPASGKCIQVLKPDNTPCQINGTCVAGECLLTCTTVDDCRPDPNFFDCVNNHCIPHTEGPLDSQCACRTPGAPSPSSEYSGVWMLLGLSLLAQRRRSRRPN